MNKFINQRKNLATHNRAMGYLMLNFKVLQGDVEEILDDYCKECSFLVNTTNLALIGAALANGGKNPLTQKQAIDPNISLIFFQSCSHAVCMILQVSGPIRLVFLPKVVSVGEF